MECSVAGSAPLAVHREGQALRVVGELDLATCQVLNTAVDSLVANGAGDIVIDCSGVTFFGAAGVDALVQAQNKLDGSRRLVIRKPSPIVRRVLGIVHLSELFIDAPDDAHHSTGD